MRKGSKMTEEARLKMSIAGKGKKLSEEHKRKIGLASKGRKVSDETRKKLSEISKGRKHTDEAKRKISEAKKGNQIWLGRKFSNEHKKRISEANKGKVGRNKGMKTGYNIKQAEKIRGRKHTQEAKNKMSETRKGRKLSEETKKKLSEAQKGKNTRTKGRKHSEQTIEKMSGKNSYMRKGGLSFQPYTTNWTKTLKRSIRERDHYTCQMCGEQQTDKAFPIHHIDYQKHNCNPENLVTLCPSCHSKTNTNRDRRQKLFELKMRIEKI